MNHRPRRVLFAFVAALYIFLMVAAPAVLAQYLDRERLRQLVEEHGTVGVGGFILIEYLFVVLVPGYNTPIHIAAGFVFGGARGWAINMIATTAGLFTIIALVRRFGRPLLRRIVSDDTLRRYDATVSRMGPLALFVMYVAPFFPDDEVTYLLAAAPVAFWRFVLPIVLGNIAKTSVSYIGDQGVGGIGITVASRLLILIVGGALICVQELWFARPLSRETKEAPP